MKRPPFCWWRAGVLTISGLHVANPWVHTYGNSTAWNAYLALAPEEMWGLLLLAMGGLLFVALWREWDRLRAIVLWLSGLWWLSVSVAFFDVMPTGQTWVVYGALGCANLLDVAVLAEVLPKRWRERITR